MARCLDQALVFADCVLAVHQGRWPWKVRRHLQAEPGSEEGDAECATAVGGDPAGAHEEEGERSATSSRAASPGSGPLPEPRQGPLVALLCVVAALEGADMALLPATFYAASQDLGLSLKGLASLSLSQALFQALLAPVWGILADRGLLERRTIFVLGCVGWGACTGLLGLAQSWWVMLVLRGANGAMLACLRPIGSGVVADVIEESDRGRVYGVIGSALTAGAGLAMVTATPLSRQVIAGVSGWRVACWFVGACSLAAGALIAARFKEPRHHSIKEDSVERSISGILTGVVAEAGRLWTYFQTPTFNVIIVQGLFGTVPWNALGSFMTLYFQVSGLSDSIASMIPAIALIGSMAGQFLGGWIGDRMARWSRLHGRPLTAQMSVFLGIPIVWLMFCGVTPGPESVPLYIFLNTLLLLTTSWCGAGVNQPILSEIVGPEDRSTLMAWDTALEGASGALFGAPLVSLLAQGNIGVSHGAHQAAPSSQLPTPEALGRALFAITAVPWFICLIFYTFLHWSYPRDLRRLAPRVFCPNAGGAKVALLQA